MSDESAETVYVIKRHGACEIRATLQGFRGKTYAGLRTFVKNDAGEFVPTKKGLTVPVDLLGDLAQAVQSLILADRKAQGYVTPGRGPKRARNPAR